MLDIFVPAFVTLMVVIDPIGVSPVFAGLTAGMSAKARRLVAVKAVLVAACILLAFALLGHQLLLALGIGLDAFRAAGGIMLFLIALEMVFDKRTPKREDRVSRGLSEERGSHGGEDISVFPLAIPMLAGPGAIASIMLYMTQYEADWAARGLVLAALGITLLSCLAAFLSAAWLLQALGRTVTATISRVLGVVLAAMAAQFIIDAVKGALG